jgi:hypothetical protein
MPGARIRLALAAGLLAAALAGCESKDYSHRPPDGLGSILLDNRTPNDINVYIDGVAQARLGDYDERAYDVEPGLHRLVLDQVRGTRYAAWDVDVVAGRLTVIIVRISNADWRRYDGEFSLRSP